jgi:hypothetical protein
MSRSDARHQVKADCVGRRAVCAMLGERASAVREAAPHIACTARTAANAGRQGLHMVDQLRDVVLVGELAAVFEWAVRLVEVAHGQSARARRAGHKVAERFTAR